MSSLNNKHEDKWVALQIVFAVIAIISGLLALTSNFIVQHLQHEEMKTQAIENGVGEYNQKTGEFQFKDKE